jgi:excisionase family DNA binding protein
MTALMTRTVLPSPAGDRDALDALGVALSGGHEVYVSAEGESAGVRLPDELRAVLVDAVAALARGNAVTVEPHRTVLTTQEAADLLGITRPTFVRLLDAGKIPFTAPGRHRRVELADVLAYRDDQKTTRRQALDAMADQATPDPQDDVRGLITTR